MNVDIERIILTGFDLTPDRAERIRAMVERDLQHLLESEGVPDSLTSRDIANLSATTLDLAATQDDVYLANSLAQSIFRVIERR